jgi:hypothetical protein
LKVSFFYKLVFLLFLLFTCTSCDNQPSNQNGLVTQSPEVASTIAVPTASPTPEPSPTPLQKKLVLLAPAGSDMGLKDSATDFLQELAGTAGLSLQVVEAVDPASLGTEVTGIVVLSPDPGVEILTQANPSIPVLAVGIPGIQGTGNLSVIPVDEAGADLQGFLAGYLAAVVTPDWRVGVISRSDSPQGKSFSLGFSNGVVFFCGLCRPVYPPYNAYPLVVNLPAEAGAADFQSAVDTLVSAGVTTVYVAPSVNDDALLQSLAQAGLSIIGSQLPPVGMEGNWVASVGIELAEILRLTGADWLAGQNPANLQGIVPVGFFHANPALFSPGRQELVNRFEKDLNTGYVDTGVDPSTGDARP